MICKDTIFFWNFDANYTNFHNTSKKFFFFSLFPLLYQKKIVSLQIVKKVRGVAQLASALA